MERKMVIVFCVVVVVFLQNVATQTGHVVGGSIGWTIPQFGAQEYATWATSNKFVVCDTLIVNFATNAHYVQEVPKASFDSCSSENPIGTTITTGLANITLTSSVFNFATNAHGVQEVPKASFDSCSSENPIGTAITTGPTNITLTSSGDHYYICTHGRHCQSGQKLAITVLAASPGASPSVPPRPSTTITPPTTHSPTSNDPAACAPVPALSPSMNGGVPTVNITPRSQPPLGSSSPDVLASFTLSVAALGVGFFF